MNSIDYAKVTTGAIIKYTAPSSPVRTKGKDYEVSHTMGSFVYHLDDHGNQVEGHKDQYSLVKAIDVSGPVKTPTKPLDDIPIGPRANAVQDQLKSVQKTSSVVIAQAIKEGQALAQSIIDEVQSQLDSIRSQTAKELHIKVNDLPTIKLETKPVPYLQRMIISAKLGKNIMLVGPAGCGKTTAASQLAEVLNLSFHNLTFTAGASETWLFGRQTPNGFVSGSFWTAYKNGGVFLADEFDAGDANLILSINTAIENGHCFNPILGETANRHPDFVLIAACNTFGKGADSTYTGRNRLDGASLRRFAGSVIPVSYDEEIEKAVCPNEKVRKALTKVRHDLLSKGSTEIVSTGCLKNVHDLMQNGVKFKDLANSLSLSWPDDLKPIMAAAIKTVNDSKAKKDNDEVPF